MPSSDLPHWPTTLPTHGGVHLRPVADVDVAMARELSTDPYVPDTGSLPRNASEEEAAAWVRRQQGRHAEGAGFSFTVVESSSDHAVGHCGLWLRRLADGLASAGYSIVASARGRGHATDALLALTELAWTIPGLDRVALHVEPWNAASVRVAERAGFTREGLLQKHQVVGGERRDVLLYVRHRPPDGASSVVLCDGSLVLRPYTEADEESFVDLFTDPEVMRHVGDGAQDAVRSHAMFRRLLDDVYPSQRFAVWGVELAGAVIGHAELKPSPRADVEGWELVYLLRRTHWRQGHGRTVASLVTTFGLDDLGLAEVFATVAPQNVGSLHLLESLGYRRRSASDGAEPAVVVLSVGP